MAREKKRLALEKENSAISVVFCDIGHVLGLPRFSPPPPHLDIFPFVAESLEKLREKDIRIGIISNTGDESEDTMNDVLRKSGIEEFFDQQLLIYSSVVGMKKNSPRIFQLAADKAG